MTTTASTTPLRLVAVATDADRARSLAASVATAFGPAAEPRLVRTVAEALKTLRTEPCDALIALHEPPTVDALMLARALRGAGDETPVAILGRDRSIDLESDAWDAGADEYVCLAETTAKQLVGRLRRAIDARQRMRQTRLLLQADQQRLARDREEAERLIHTQQRLLAELRGMPAGEAAAAPAPTVRLATPHDGAEDDYAALARAAVLNEATPSAELSRLADRLADEGVTGPRFLQRHLAVVEEITAGLPPKTTLVMRGQADRLLLESVLHLAEAYRRRYLETVQNLTTGQPVRETPAARAA